VSMTPDLPADPPNLGGADGADSHPVFTC
jgi:hypothetical protein